MTINLPIKELKEFISLSKFVSQDKTDLLPITNFLKFEIEFGDVKITKDNIREFICHTFLCNVDDCSFLLPDEKLTKYVADSNGEYIQMTFGLDCVDVFDGYKKQKWALQGYKVKDYPTPSELPTDFVQIKKEVLNILGLTKVITDPNNKIQPMFAVSYIKSNCVYASDRSTMIKKDIDTGYRGLIAVSEKEVQCLSQFDTILYASSSGNHNVWKTGNTVYGFRREEGVDYDYHVESFFEHISNPRKEYITISTKDILNFCKSTKDFDSAKVKNSKLHILKSRVTVQKLRFWRGKFVAPEW
jgi:hypothetical protein